MAKTITKEKLRKMGLDAAKSADYIVNQKAPIFDHKNNKRKKTRQTQKDKALKEYQD